VSNDLTRPQDLEKKPGARDEQPDDAPMQVRAVDLPDGRYCLLFTFGADDRRE
jgi:hypothetical protein